MGGKTETHQLKRLLRALYQDGGIHTELRVRDGEEITARKWSKSPDSAQDFADNHGGSRKSTAAVYYGLGSRIDRGRGDKDNVSSVPALWADIDVGKLGWDLARVVRAFHELPGVLQPGALIFSGGGLHAYWFLDVPWECDGKYGHNTKAFEAVNKNVQLHCASDMVWDITRVLRVPGTYNSRSKKMSRIVWCYPWHRASLDEYRGAWDGMNDFLGPDGFAEAKFIPQSELRGITPQRAWAHVSGDKRRGRVERVDEVWAMTRVGGGGPFHGVDEAQLLTTCYEWISAQPILGEVNRAAKADWIVDRTLRQTRAVAEDAGVAESWDWDAERMTIRDKLVRWIDRWDAEREEFLAEKKRSKAGGKKRRNGPAVAAD